MSSENVAMLVMSCDKYSWLWDSWYRQWTKHWEVDIPVYFVTETKQIPEWPGITPIYVGAGHTWSKCLLLALVKVPHETIFFSLEDYWPTQNMTEELFMELYNDFIDRDLLCLRCSHPSHFYVFEKDGRLTKESEYLISCQTSFWDKNYLISCIDISEDPWQFEVRGTKRLRKRELAHRTVFRPLKWYIHACVKGELTEDGKCFISRTTRKE